MNIEKQIVFAGHSDYITALAAYDVKSQLYAMFTGKPAEPIVIPDESLFIESSLNGGLFEILILPEDDFKSNLTMIDIKSNNKNIQIPYPKSLNREYAFNSVLRDINILINLQNNNSKVRLIHYIEDFDIAQKEDSFAVVMHLADADAIDTDFKALHHLYKLGLRSLAITWSRSNAFGFGVPYLSPGHPDVGPGLTDDGKNLVHACNKLGVLIDLSHLNYAGFMDVSKLSTAPLVVTHGAAHKLSPTSRGLTDEQLKIVAASAGIVGISLEGVTPSANGIVSDMLEQINYLVNIMGIEHVSLGSDLYTKPDKDFPNGKILIPDLIAALQIANYSEDMISKILYKNWLRVLKETW